MYYKKYGELPRIPNTKSEHFLSNVCEFTNQLDKLESDNRNANEISLKKSVSAAAKEESLKSDERASKQRVGAEQTKVRKRRKGHNPKIQ